MEFPKKTVITFDEYGGIVSASLRESQNIQGVFCANGKVEFYETGKIKSATLARDQEIQPRFLQRIVHDLRLLQKTLIERRMSVHELKIEVRHIVGGRESMLRRHCPPIGPE